MRKEGRKDRDQDRSQDRYQDRGKYADILFHPHPVSKKHPPMDRSVRAAQFSPFAALTGYDAAIRETGRLTDRFVELEEDDKAVLDEKLQQVKWHLDQKRTESLIVTITYFQPDERKDGGEYKRICGNVKRIDEQERVLVMGDGQKIYMDRIVEMVEEVKIILAEK